MFKEKVNARTHGRTDARTDARTHDGPWHKLVAIQLAVWEEKIFKGFLLWLPWQPELYMEHNYLKEFERGPPKVHSCEIWLKSSQ